MSQISEFQVLLSLIATIVGAVTSYLVIRVQRDMAKLKDQILEGINGKYISRKEYNIIERDIEDFRKSISEEVKERGRQHHLLHEQFIECRAKHGGTGR
jgi:phosphoglycerate-specific signal transduction histidine kinase